MSSETLAGVAAVWLLAAQIISLVYSAIPRDAAGTTDFWLALLVLVIGLAPIIWVTAYRRGWRRKQTRLNLDFNEVVASGRPYTLYLRPFVTSGRIKVPNDWPHFGQRMLLGDPWDMELALATVIGTDTPLVAIGDTRGGVGAAKLTTSDDDWREHMLQLAEKARLILAVPLDRPSTLWEMETIKTSDALREKTAFVMPPSSRLYDFLFFLFRRSIAARWRRSARHLKKAGFILPRYRRRGGFFLIGPDGKPSRLAGFRNFRPAYVDNMLNDLSVDGPRPADRIAWFNKAYGGVRWLRPRIFGQLSLLGLYTPSGFKRILLLVSFWMLFMTAVFQLRAIPSANMMPTVLVGDRIVASNFAYGYSRASIPFNLGVLLLPDDPANPYERLFGQTPSRGDVVLVQHSYNNLIYVSRVIGLPGDTVQMKRGRLVLNGTTIERNLVRSIAYVPDDGEYLVRATEYREQLPGETTPHLIHEFGDDMALDETPAFTVPAGHVFLMGDNRDNSEDSRAPSGHSDLAERTPEAWPNTAVYPHRDPGDNAIGFAPFDHLLARVETVPFSQHACRKAEGADCLQSKIWQDL